MIFLQRFSMAALSPNSRKMEGLRSWAILRISPIIWSKICCVSIIFDLRFWPSSYRLPSRMRRPATSCWPRPSCSSRERRCYSLSFASNTARILLLRSSASSSSIFFLALISRITLARTFFPLNSTHDSCTSTGRLDLSFRTSTVS